VAREIIHIEIQKKSGTSEVGYTPGPIGRFFLPIIVGLVAIAIFTVALLVGLSMMLLVWVMLVVAIASMIVRSFFMRASRNRRLP
jgi:hypothetical protein